MFYILRAFLLLYGLRHVKLFIKRIWMNEYEWIILITLFHRFLLSYFLSFSPIWLTECYYKDLWRKRYSVHIRMLRLNTIIIISYSFSLITTKSIRMFENCLCLSGAILTSLNVFCLFTAHAAMACLAQYLLIHFTLCGLTGLCRLAPLPNMQCVFSNFNIWCITRLFRFNGAVDYKLISL